MIEFDEFGDLIDPMVAEVTTAENVDSIIAEDNCKAATSAVTDRPKSKLGGAPKRPRPEVTLMKQIVRVGISSGSGNGVPSRRRMWSSSSSGEETSLTDVIIESVLVVRL